MQLKNLVFHFCFSFPGPCIYQDAYQHAVDDFLYSESNPKINSSRNTFTITSKKKALFFCLDIS